MRVQKRATYHFEVCPGDNLQGPSDDEIAEAIKSRPGGVPSFVILTKKKNHFMQTGGSVSEGFELEYQEFSRDGHWEHENSGEVPADVVIQAFQWYAQDDDRWRTQLHWKRLVHSDLAKRREETCDAWHKSLPRDGFFKTLVKGLRQIALEELGLKRRPRR